MHLHHFNAASTADATAVVRVWADIPGWVDAVVAGRPYADVDALAAYAGDLAAVWSPDDLEAALHAHPRIGAKVAGDGAEAAASRREQGSMASAADDDVAAIAAGNAAYEERFGRVFLIRAAGRTPSEMRTELERRLGNDPDTEIVEATRQLAEIALLRLRTTFADEAPAEPEDAE
ncbi:MULTISPECIES: 2-oxo-4-hydroxy-4-carboxy-5-ureidoimidazoline decarboxylase [Microbacterium]|uniref:2-oxo-4-hydroxy-4-carboxy-5-ureidoimidazoline decarboxylase n=1 Tax=Microbacterium TaxID=33882 RepID=UPI0023DAC59A|nr:MULTISPECIES: 2-oxo-4-hydroxy-4-carboxy-5-ureidoimidazoline decarboxylase [Microbacterium]MDF2048003.1 2-oxo-4-hydroxy-4-carboxy-5-ureidoimidazoline decarboxylase [Microbacterium sp. Kw_RZR3]MDQ1074742.1 2-oxo-4-hydroxy-4-carboxy-5-ureidoimidazoline decarboxylase [Microbacterium sp. SORGH_AS_0969]MDQ1114967.1 2-oxo-4-hydroxy-4-carboxy-5-ureidoimidazoline decarboxylase [Microbacterium testaceum]